MPGEFNRLMEMSGVWIRCPSGKDVVITCAHYFADAPIPQLGNDEAVVFSSRSSRNGPGVKCTLHAFDHGRLEDWAIFVPVNKSYTHKAAIPIDRLHAPSSSSWLDEKICFSVGYNSERDPERFRQEASNIKTHLKHEDDIPDMKSYLHADQRSLGAGKFEVHEGKVCHNVPGWYGASGAPMYAVDEGKVQLVCLCTSSIHHHCFHVKMLTCKQSKEVVLALSITITFISIRQ